MARPTVEYVGFHSTNERREYVLLLRSGAETREYTVGIAHTAFTSGMARYQDGPEISYLKLTRELLVSGDPPAAADYTISESELTDYRDAHTVTKNRLGPSVAPAIRPPVPDAR
jgi:hypothetical protein